MARFPITRAPALLVVFGFAPLTCKGQETVPPGLAVLSIPPANIGTCIVPSQTRLLPSLVGHGTAFDLNIVQPEVDRRITVARDSTGHRTVYIEMTRGHGIGVASGAEDVMAWISDDGRVTGTHFSIQSDIRIDTAGWGKRMRDSAQRAEMLRELTMKHEPTFALPAFHSKGGPLTDAEQRQVLAVVQSLRRRCGQ